MKSLAILEGWWYPPIKFCHIWAELAVCVRYYLHDGLRFFFIYSNFEFLLHPKIIIKQQNWLNFFSSELLFHYWVWENSLTFKMCVGPIHRSKKKLISAADGLQRTAMVVLLFTSQNVATYSSPSLNVNSHNVISHNVMIFIWFKKIPIT